MYGPSIQVDPLWAAAMVVCPLLGMALHELTHYLAARALGVERVRIQVLGDAHPLAFWDWSPYVEYEIEASRSELVDRFINSSPLLVGLSTLAAALLTEFSLSMPIAPLALGWFYYTLGGGLEDYSMTVASGKHWWRDQPLFVRQYVGGLGVWAAGLYMASVYRPALPGWMPPSAGGLLNYGGLGLLFGGGIVFAMAIRNVDTIPESHPLRTPIKEYF